MDAKGGCDRTPITSDDLDVGFSSGGNALFPPIRRRESYRNLARPPPPARSDKPAIGFFFDDLSDEEPSRHFLDSCALCKTPLTGNRDIFMYRGDTPFCSEECRQEQMEADEAKERRRSWKFSTSTANQQSEPRNPSFPNSQKIHATVVAS